MFFIAVNYNYSLLTQLKTYVQFSLVRGTEILLHDKSLEIKTAKPLQFTHLFNFPLFFRFLQYVFFPIGYLCVQSYVKVTFLLK